MMSRAAHAEARSKRCPSCDGWALKRGAAPACPCPACKGTGRNVLASKREDLLNG